MASARTILAYILITGIAAGLSQVVLSRELLVVASGTELVIALLLAAWLVGGALGSAWAEGGASNPYALSRRAWKLSWLVGPALGFGVAVARLIRPLLALLPPLATSLFAEHPKLEYLLGRLIGLQPGEALGLVHIVCVGLVATLPAAFLCAANFVTGARLLQHLRGPGSAYAMDAIGHLLGGVALAFAATVWLDGLWVAALCTPACMLAGLLLLPAAGRAENISTGAAAGLFMAVMLAAAGPSRAARWVGQEVVAERASLMGLVTATKQAGGGVYLFENGVPVTECPPIPGRRVLVDFALLQVAQPKRVLLIGGGVYGGIEACLEHGARRVDYVEFDPVFLEFAKRYASGEQKAALNDPHVRCFAMDPRLFLRQSQGQYDAIVINLPAPTTALFNRFFTEQFFELCASMAADGAVVAFGLPYSQFYRGWEMMALDRCILATATAAGRRACALMAGEFLGVAVGLRGSPPLTEDPLELQRRALERGVNADYLLAYAWDWLNEFNLAQARELFRGEAATNRDEQPTGYFLGTLFWLAQVTPTAALLLRPLAERGEMAGWWMVLAGALLALASALAAVRSRRMAAWVAMFCAGAAGMALELVLVFALQVVHGYVYGLVGVLIGAFMVGIAAGAVWAEALGGRAGAAPSAIRRRCAAAAAALAACTAAVWALHWAVGEAVSMPWPVFAALAVVAGLGVGMVFPTAVDAWAGQRRHRGVGLIYLADLLGGLLAAAAVPALALPLAGIWLSAAPLCAAALVGLAALAAAR